MANTIANKTVVVAGASRGLGLEFVRQILSRPGNKVIAGVRRPAEAKELAALGSAVKVLALDTSDEGSIKKFAAAVREVAPHADLYIHNAGIYTRGALGELTSAALVGDFVTNTVGPLLAVQALSAEGVLGHAPGASGDGSTVAILTSKMGSIDDNTSGGSYSYRASKVAVNIVAKSLSIDLAPAGVTVTLLHPGFVRTDMTSGRGFIDADESVRGMLSVLEQTPLEDLAGGFRAFDGKVIPW